MDRISKAVERARKEREARRQSEPARTQQEAGEVTYTKTRKIALDHDYITNNHILTGESDADFEHAFKVLRTRIWRQIRENGWTSIAVTSCNPGEGKSLVAINLAISLAMMKANHSVLLVDLDLRRPTIHEKLGLQVDYGINDYLTNGVGLEQILVNPGIGRFVILPGREPVAHSSEVLSSARMENLVQEFKSRYPSRIVVFDLPPVISTDDVLVFSPNVDAVLLVIEDGKTQTHDVTKAVNMLKGANLIGTVLNKSLEATPASY